MKVLVEKKMPIIFQKWQREKTSDYFIPTQFRENPCSNQVECLRVKKIIGAKGFLEEGKGNVFDGIKLCYINSDSYLRLAFFSQHIYSIYIIHIYLYTIYVYICIYIRTLHTHMQMNTCFFGFFIFGVVWWKVAKERLSHLQATMNWTCIPWPHWSGFPSDVFSSPRVHSLMQLRFCSIIYVQGILQMAFLDNHTKLFAPWIQVQVWHIIACASMESLNGEIYLTLEWIR